MKSIWYEMGIREGKFCGVEQTKFLNTLYRFYYDLQQKCRASLSPYNVLDGGWDFDFSGRIKCAPSIGEHSDWASRVDKMCAPPPVPYGTPITQEYWNSAGPEWKEKDFKTSVDNLLGQEKVNYPLYRDDTGLYFFPRGLRRVGELDWEKQQYRIVSVMRYCIVPLLIRNDTGGIKWSAGYMHSERFEWSNHSGRDTQIIFEFPEYWKKATVKVGVFAKNTSKDQSLKVPVDGSFWANGKTPYIITTPDGTDYDAQSELRIYGAVDLATHPDFMKFFGDVDK